MAQPVKVIAALDQGTVNTKWTYYAADDLSMLASARLDHTQIYPHAGWVEHDPVEIWRNTLAVMNTATEQLRRRISNFKVAALGVASQRETLVVWDHRTGRPLYNAIVWLDNRTADLVDFLCGKYGGPDCFMEKTGLPIASYFSAVKLLWLLENFRPVKDALVEGRAYLGTVDSWLVWNLTGGAKGGKHVTDVTNASRTLLMDINKLQWSTQMRRIFCDEVSFDCFPEILSNCDNFGRIRGVKVPELEGVPITACAGDQQADCIGHCLVEPGQVKSTFGTGASVLMITGPDKPCTDAHGVMATPCYQLGKDAPVVYALEGTVAIAGAALIWLKDNMEAINSSREAEGLLVSVDDTGGVYFVPAFAGLFAPRWNQGARGCCVGITQHTTRAHIVRALFESIGFSLYEILDAMKQAASTQSKGPFRPEQYDKFPIRVDGGLAADVPSALKLTADIIGRAVETPADAEVTSLGIAMLAGIGCGSWDLKRAIELCSMNTRLTRHVPRMKSEERVARLERWGMAVTRALDWAESQGESDASSSIAPSVLQRKYTDRMMTVSVDSDSVEVD